MGSDAAGKGRARQRTGRHGQSLVETLFHEMDLQPRTEAWDDGEDFNVEFTRPDGRWERVFVQVKGTAEGFPTSKDGTWSVRLRANALARYRRAAHPVVLVAVDVRTGECRWDDLRSIATVPPGPATIRVPISERLTFENRATFIERLSRIADALRGDVLPAPNALAQEEARLRALDPRWAFRLTANSEGITRELWPVAGAAALEIRGELAPESAALMDEHIRYGTPVFAEFRNFAVSGSPVFEELGVAQTALVELAKPGSVHELAVGWIDSNGIFQRALEGPAVAYSGQEGLEMRLNGPGLPFELTIRGVFAATARKERRALTGSFRFQFGGWDGHPFRKLPWWDGVYPFLQALVGGKSFALARREFGQYVDVSTFLPSENLKDFATKALAALGPLPSVVAAARLCESDHTWREGVITGEEIQRWAIVDRILHNEVVGLSPQSWVLPGYGEVPEYQEGALLHFLSPIHLRPMGESIGQINVIWRLANYQIRQKPDAEVPTLLLTPTPASTAHAMLHDQATSAEELVALIEQRLMEQTR